MRIGYGFDTHKLVEGRKLILGGVEIPFEKGLLGHSDADVLLHAITDALLGAVALGDIGQHFPDTDPEFKDADSRKLLTHCYQLVKKEGYILGNIDATVVAQRPKLMPFMPAIRQTIADDLEVNLNQISVKATTSEKMGFVGREEGITVSAVALLLPIT
ncbi:MAG: 2-C-methyl-D-erythritol 2,4-cyclodiphosphate synthase [Balneolaceae bacterium]|nr:2-C-methyl-D-erythritol 2,4-cyclodiphosphate synthase [Balneolaceae bacterium]